MKILVTGANGLLGSALRRLGDTELAFANRADGDLRDPLATSNLLKRYKPDAIIHCAALVGGIGGNIAKSGDYFRDNILINTNILEAARDLEIQNLTTFMSTCVFPNETSYPLEVKNLHAGPPHPSNFAYAHAKRMLEVQTRAYNTQWGTNFKVLIPTNLYGENDNFHLEEGHVIPSLIHRMFLAKQNGTAFRIWGTGKPLREFVYSGDVAKIAVAVAKNETLAEPLIVTSAIELPIVEVCKEIARAMDFDGIIEHDLDKPDGQFRKPSDPVPFREMFPEFEFTSINLGIKATVDWFLDNYPSIRR